MLRYLAAAAKSQGLNRSRLRCLPMFAAFLLVWLFSGAAQATTFCGATIPPEIVAQAAALKNDPDLIYEFVYNNIQTLPQHGSLKGPLGTLIDRSGSEVDQAELMASLLQAAGNTTAAYQSGTITVDAAQLTSWLGTDNSPYSSAHVLANGGYAVTATLDGGGSHLLYVTIPWAWVKVQIGAATYIFDPAGKRISGYNRTVGIGSLAGALGYTQSAFLSNAEAGATITDRTIAGLNRNGLRANLQSYSSNLVNYIRAHNLSASTGDIVGGTAIVPLAVGAQQRILAASGFAYAASSPTDSACLPTSLRTQVTFAMPGPGGSVTVTFNTADIYGHRLSLFFDSTVHPVLRLDGVVQITGSAAVPGNQVTLTTSIVHNAYATTFADVTNNTSLKVVASANGAFVISNGWGRISRGMAERHRLLLQQNSAQSPGSSTAEPILGEGLTLLGFQWLGEFSQSQALLDEIAGTSSIYQYGVGIVGIRPVGASTGPYIDLPLNNVAITQRLADPVSGLGPLWSAVLFSMAETLSVLESGIIEQTQPGAIAVSTAELIDLASQTDTIYDINNNDVPGDNAAYYNSIIRPNLVSTWNSTDLGRIDSAVAGNQRVLAPKKGNWVVNSLWTGGGYYEISQPQSTISALITGGLSGGYPASPVADPLYVANISITFKPSSFDPTTPWPGISKSPSSWLSGTLRDPVNRVTGSFTYTNSDLQLGSASLPIGLQFQRYYDSSASLRTGPLGLGWTNNFAISATADSDGFEGMASNSPINGASTIAVLYVMQDILNRVTDTKKPLDQVVIANLSTAWLIERLTNNVVAITQPESSSVFVKLANGTYNPPLGSADRLSLASGAYTLAQKDGTVVTFNSTSSAAPGAIATWHSPAGPTVTYSYNSAGYLTSVTTGTGATGSRRTLTLAYNGSNQLTGVSDGNGRSVSYAYDTSGNLAHFTDALGNVSSYVYDPANPGRMTQYFHPSLPAIPFITNTYDAVGRIARQTDANGNTTNQYYAGTRTETDDALGNSHVLYFSERGQALIDIDGLGNQTVSTYDGLDRLITVTLPQGNGVSYTYDAQGNPVTITSIPRSGSGLSPLTTTIAYDPLWNAPSSVTDPLGLVTKFFYDHVTGSLLKTIADAGGGTGHTSVVTGSFTYNARGQAVTSTDAANRVALTAYDSFGNPVSVTRDYGGLNQVTTTTYDAVGNAISVTDPNGNVASSTYDARRRVTSTTAPPTGAVPGPVVTAFTYDADDHLLQTTQSAGGAALRSTSSTYTNIGQVAASTDANGNVTTFAYDAAGQLLSVTDPRHSVTGYSYDADGRRTAVSNLAIQAGPLSQVSFTANGLPHALTDANGHAITLSYDGLDRLSATTYPDSTVETLSHDGDGNVVSRVTRKGDTLSYTYTTLNQLCSKAVATTPTSCTAATSANPTVWYTYDILGRTAGAHDNGASLAAVTGSPVSFATNASYDALNRPITISWSPVPAQATPSASSVTFTHGYDGNNRRITQSATDTGWWSVPSLPASTSYVANALNQYTAVNAVTPTYDVNGNLVFDGSFTYCRDAEGRLTGILSAGTCASPTTTVASYAYDSQGRRKSRTTGGATTIYITDDANHAVLEYNGGTGSPRAWYTYGATGVLNRMDVAAGSRDTLVPDAQGSIVGSLGSSSGTMTRWGYRPYGENPSLTTDSFAYTAQRHDPETSGGSAEPSGLYYARARMYSPTLGRFLEPDPSSDSATNLYAYVGNDPVNMTDPSGMFAEGVANMTSSAWGATSNWWNAPGSNPYPHPVDNYLANAPFSAGLSAQETTDGFETRPDTHGDYVIAGLQVAGMALPAFRFGGAASAAALGDSGAVAADTSAFARIGSTGQIGEDELRILGGIPKKYFPTNLGARYIDRFVDGAAHESKVGYQSLTASNRLQILKDVDLMQSNGINSSTWHFFTSPVTGKVGPSAPLANFLQNSGITIRLH